jgi:hypothetical protein
MSKTYVGRIRFALLAKKGSCNQNPALLTLALHAATTAKGNRMDWDDYLRDQAANYRKLAETADDPLVKQEHFELAAVCEEVANSIGDRLPGG